MTWAEETSSFWIADQGNEEVIEVGSNGGGELSSFAVNEANPPRGIAWGAGRLWVATASHSGSNADVVSLYTTSGSRLEQVPVDAPDPGGMFPKGLLFDDDPTGPYLLMTDEGDDDGIHVYRIEGCEAL